MHKIPVTIITGFLGAGKTTLIRQLLQNPQGRRIAVLVNEFGEVGIDGDLLRSCRVCDEDEPTEPAETNILELTNGCLCCTVQEEFLPTMQQLITRRDQIDCIVIETSGLALPKPLVQAFRWPEIRTAATVDSVITLVDCEALAAGDLVGDLPALEAQRQADDSLDHETPLEELFEDQLNCADLVLLTKVDKVSEGDRTRIETWLTRQLPHPVKVLGLAGGEGSHPISPDLLLGFNAAVEDNLDSRPSHHDHEHDHDHDDDIVAIPVVLDQGFEPKALVKRLEQLAAAHDIYRIKGFVAVPNKAMRLVLQGVGKRFDYFYDRPWKPQEARQTKLVFIGHGLEQATVEAALFERDHALR
ncbi:cobalamin biosynthesis protein CobW [filamentous cyanobacterium CCP3]|nr:cobalamin biosynthesis protein CobW [filamentous cyanobacterium CCP3]